MLSESEIVKGGLMYHILHAIGYLVWWLKLFP